MRDLRDYLKHVEEMGELKVITGAHWDLEIGRLAELLFHRDSTPAVLFDEIPGHPKGFRVLVNGIGSFQSKRLGLCLGIPSEKRPIDLVRSWRSRVRELKMMKPRFVSEGPILENVEEGKEVDLLKFPTPKWHPLDGGRYIGTGSVTITRDPDEGWVNLGTQRVMVHDRNTLGFFVAQGTHTSLLREKYWARGEPCQVAISFGHEPAFLLAGSLEFPYGFSEYEFIGGLRGEPVEVIEGKHSGLPIPAYSEIAIEGEARPDELLPEGPFGEFPGYYGSGQRPEPTIKVKRVMYRNEPIILGSPPTVPPSDTTRANLLLRSALIWDELERAGVLDVRGVWCHPAAPRFIVAIAIKQRYPGHPRQAGLITLGSYPGLSQNGRYVIIVDEDIDPSDTTQLLWALGTRTIPEKSIEVIRELRSTALDPMIRQGEPLVTSRAIIDACRPWSWIGEFPATISSKPEELEESLKKWGHLIYG